MTTTSKNGNMSNAYRLLAGIRARPGSGQQAKKAAMTPKEPETRKVRKAKPPHEPGRLASRHAPTPSPIRSLQLPQKVASPTKSLQANDDLQVPRKRASNPMVTASTVVTLKRGRLKRYEIPACSAEEPIAAPAFLTVPVSVKPAPFHRTIQLIYSVPSLRANLIPLLGQNLTSVVRFEVAHMLVQPALCIILRFAKTPCTKPAAEAHPPNLRLVLNKTRILVSPGIVSYRLKAGKDNFCAPVEVPLSAVSTSPAYNELSVEWTELEDAHGRPLLKQDFCMFIEVAECLTVDTVLEQLSSQTIPIFVRLSQLYVRMSAMDDEICADSQVISLLCPLSRQRIKIPSRGKKCLHIECFDAFSYISMNKMSKSKWLCPRCNASVPLEELVIDEFFQDLLEFTEEASVDVTSDSGTIIVCEKKKTAPQGFTMSLDESTVKIAIKFPWSDDPIFV